MDIYESIKELCEQNGISIVGLERELGFGRGSIGKLKNGQRIRSDRLHKIEEYFGGGTRTFCLVFVVFTRNFSVSKLPIFAKT